MTDKDTQFFHTHIGIFNDLKDKHKKCKLYVKNNYAKLIYHKHDICEIVLYATNNSFEISVTCGNIDYGGLNNDFGILNNWYVSKDTIDDYKKYKVKTQKYLSTLIEYISTLHYCFEYYQNFCVDYRALILSYVSELGQQTDDYLLWSYHFEEKSIKGDYWLNAFANFPIMYKDVNAHSDFLKQLISLRNKSDKLNEEIFLKDNFDISKLGKKLISKLSPKQKELFNDYIYVDTETIDVMYKEHSLDRQGGYMPSRSDIITSL